MAKAGISKGSGSPDSWQGWPVHVTPPAPNVRASQARAVFRWSQENALAAVEDWGGLDNVRLKSGGIGGVDAAVSLRSVWLKFLWILGS